MRLAAATIAVVLSALAGCGAGAPAEHVQQPLPSGAASSPAPASTPSGTVPEPQFYDPAAPSLAALRDATLRPGSFELVERLEGSSAYERWGIAYGSEDLTISGELFIPAGNGPHPLVITAHGHIDPAIYTRGRGLRREQAALATRGFAVLHPDYRGHGLSDGSANDQFSYDAGIAYSVDVANAVLALRAFNDPRIDTTRVGILGHSMGGGVALNLAVARPELFQALVLYAPVHADAWKNFDRWRSDGERGDATRAARGTRETRPAEWDAISAQAMLTNLQAPIHVFHGTADRDVPFSWSEDLVRAATDAGGAITLTRYDGEGHEFGPRWREFIDAAADFFDAELRSRIAEEEGAAEGGIRPLELYDPARITKKPFGIRIDPATSPVQPERFRGYHTGADFELVDGEDPHAISVTALCDGAVLRAGRVNGYGGVVVQSCAQDDEAVTVLYGHLDPGAITVDVGNAVRIGDTLGRLGTGFSDETDGERAHLHLAVHRGIQEALRGYVEAEADLSAWMDPRALLP